MARVSKILICGFGAFGELHARAWRRLDPDISLMVADPSPEARRKAVQFGIPDDWVAADPVQLLSSADVVDVVAPPAMHLPLALMGLREGKPVMIEKPAVRTVEEARQLVAACDETDKPVQIGFVLRAHPLTQEARRLLSEGEIGELIAIDGKFSGWKRMRADSSLLENDGVHFLDLMRFLANAPALEVDVRAWSLLDAEVNDDLLVEIRHANGVRARLHLGILMAGEVEDPFVPSALTSKRLTLIGRTGNIAIDFNRNQMILSKVAYQRKPGGHDVSPQSVMSRSAINATPETLLAQSFRLFRSAVEEGAPVMCDARTGALEMTETLAAADRALAEGKTTLVGIGDFS